MKKFIIGFILGSLIAGSIVAVAAGIVKTEMQSTDAGSMVGYGTADAGDTIVRIKTSADGTLLINGV